MIANCAIAVGAPSLARDILASTDCLVTERIQAGYAALLAPGGSFGQALTLALTIYVAIFGYRLILGLSSLTLGEVVPHFIKIGLILALATNWAGYQVVVFDLLFHGPQQVADAIVRQVSDTQATGQGDVLAALQSIFDRLTDYASDAWAQINAVAPFGIAKAAPVAPIVPGGALSPPVPIALPFQLGAPQFVAGALWLAALVMMAASVGVLLVVRIILALLLLLGPLFIACALFSGTRGLFEGWLRTTVKFAVVPLFTLPLTAALIAVLLPFIDQLGDAPIENFRDGPALGIVLIVLVFAAVLFQSVQLAGGIAAGIRLPRRRVADPLNPVTLPVPPTAAATAPAAPSRAEILVQSMANGTRSGASRSIAIAGSVAATTRIIGTPATAQGPQIDPGLRLGQGYRRLAIAIVPARRTGP